MKIQIGKHELRIRLDSLYQTIDNIEAGRHCNADYELFVILRGGCTFEVEKECCELSSGDALLVFPTHFHCALRTTADVAMLVLPFAPKDNPFATDGVCERISLSPFAIDACRRLVHEQKAEAPFHKETVLSCCTVLLAEVLRLAANGAEGKKADVALKSENRFAIIDDFFEKGSIKRAGEETLANLLHLSRRQLNRILVANYGMCFREKLLRSRMDRAGVLLRTTKMPLAEVSENVGYLSMTAFFKAFKAHYKTTPKLYRESFLKGDKGGAV